MLIALIVVTLLLVCSLAAHFVAYINGPPRCEEMHYDPSCQHVSGLSYYNDMYNTFLQQERVETQKHKDLAEERLRMLHRLNDIYLNRESNRD